MKGFKTGGRQKGTTNKITKELRATLSNLIENELKGLETRLKGLEDKKRIELLIKLLPYAVPQLKQTFNIEDDTPTEFEVNILIDGVPD